MAFYLGEEPVGVQEAVSLLARDGQFVTDRRSSDPVNRLSRELDLACTTSTNPHQIAALLEAAGLNDRIVRERYSHPDVFALASDLYGRVPLRTSEPHPVAVDADQEHVQDVVAALLMRGPIYLLPALFFVAARMSLVRDTMMIAGLVALFLAWAWNQGLGSLVHRLIGRENMPAARSMSRLSLLAGTIAVTATVSLVVPGAYGDLSISLFAAGQTAYLISAATLLTLGKDRLLSMALVPGVTILGLLVIPGMPAWLVGAAMLLTLILVVGAMIWVTRLGKRPEVRSLSRKDLSVAVLHALLGAVWATIIGVAGLSIVDTPGLVGTVSIAAAPMVLTMGVAEWQLLRLRRTTKSLLIDTDDPSRFATGVRRSFGRSVAILAAAVASTATLISAGSFAAGILIRPGVVLAFGFAWLAIAFYCGLVLLSLGRIVVPLAASIYMAAFVAFMLIAAPQDALAGAGLYAAGCLGLAAVLVAAVLAVVPKAVVHR